MNTADRKDLEIIHNKIDNIQQDIVDLKHDMSMAHGKTDASLSFIKENLFNPKEGLWAETRRNTEYREGSSKWRGIIGAGFIGLFFKHLYDIFVNN